MIQTSNKPHVYMCRISGHLTTSGKPRHYIGGTTAGDPYYTHSAESSEEFRNLIPHKKRPLAERKSFIENPPSGISRRILIEFDVITEENEKEIKNKVWKTENKFLLNRKERCWDRYYNVSTGNPFYVDMSGKNNPGYIDGRAVGRNSPDKEVRRLAEYRRDQVPKRKEQNRRKQKKFRDKNKLLTGFSKGYSQKGSAHKCMKGSKIDIYGEGKLDAFFK